MLPAGPSSSALPVGLHAPLDLRSAVADVLSAAGLHVSDPREAVEAPVVAIWDGVPRSDASDRWLGDSRAHLVVMLHRGRVDVGPFVDPGVTACLRCLHAAGALPARDENSGRSLRRPPTGLVLLAAALAAHDVGRWHAGQMPATWSATLALDPGLVTSRRTWWRHPHCGCSWGLAADGTHGAV